MPSTVYIVHCVDAEGPLYEPLSATFERLKTIFHLDLEPSRSLLSKLQRGEVDLGGREKAVQKVLDPHLLAYNDTWDKIGSMLSDALAASFRDRVLDSRGNGWVYNWFCVDHVDYEVNPRRRDIGYHNIFDHYRQTLEESDSLNDGLHFHYHPHAFRKAAHLNATHLWASSDSLFQVLSRRIIDRHWFPAVCRSGGMVNRPDSHWFLEQFFPFSLDSLALEPSPEDEQQFDLSHGRFDDWRRAPRTWTPYHPSHDDYETPGDCRRWIARCLNVGTRVDLLTESAVRQAFQEARDGKPVVMAYADHDFRDIRDDVNQVRELLRKAALDFPDVDFRFSEAAMAMREALSLPKTPPCNLELTLKAVEEGAHILTVRSNAPTFGPQPYLAIKTVTGSYHHDNFDFQVPNHEWTYVFDEMTFPLRAVETVGVATNNSYGVTTVSTLDTLTGKVDVTCWNEDA